MRKILTVLLAFAMLLSMAACGGAPAGEEALPTTEPKRDYSEFAGIVEDTKSWYDQLMAMPIANAEMTEDELRQLAADAFRINLSFTWTPTQALTYEFTLLERTTGVDIPKDIAYAGLFYNNNNARGNIWKVLQYYDHETGAVDMEALGSNQFMVLSSACSYGYLQAVNRVSNSHGLTGMDSYNQNGSNIVLVGPYTYEPHEHSFSHGDGTPRIIEKNGEQVMCESYAAMKMADGLYSSSSYHVMMCAEMGEVFRWSDGRIDPEQSYLYVHEQRNSNETTTQGNGVQMRLLGTVHSKYTFKKLLENGYVPFTVKELVGQEPIEPGEAWIGTRTSRVDAGAALTAEEIFANQVWGNYNVCTVEVQVKNAEGKVLLSYDAPPISRPDQFSVAFGSGASQLNLQPYANGTNTIHVYAQLSNGELLEAFQTVLKVE